jgi:hypothetical protein
MPFFIRGRAVIYRLLTKIILGIELKDPWASWVTRVVEDSIAMNEATLFYTVESTVRISCRDQKAWHQRSARHFISYVINDGRLIISGGCPRVFRASHIQCDIGAVTKNDDTKDWHAISSHMS